MSISKRFLKSKPICKVSFKVQPELAADAKEVAIAGDFTDWKPLKMKALKDGSFKYDIDLEQGRAYAFRYLLDNTTWVNDPEADKYVSNGIDHQQNCVIEA